MKTNNVVGLFGTYNSRWREDIAIPLLEKAGVPYFNPIVPKWDEQARRSDAEHAAKDAVLMLVVTGESTGMGSMAESGWIALKAFLSNHTVVMVFEDMAEEVTPHKDELGGLLDPNGNRDLIRQHIAQLPKVFHETIILCPDVKSATLKAIEIMKRKLNPIKS
jgi:hypothetical protein